MGLGIKMLQEHCAFPNYVCEWLFTPPHFMLILVPDRSFPTLGGRGGPQLSPLPGTAGIRGVCMVGMVGWSTSDPSHSGRRKACQQAGMEAEEGVRTDGGGTGFLYEKGGLDVLLEGLYPQQHSQGEDYSRAHSHLLPTALTLCNSEGETSY